MDVKTAIDTGDSAALGRLLSEDPARANELITWGRSSEIRTHPLHYVSDALFAGTLRRGAEIPLIDALLEAGSNRNYQATNGETALIGAASLHAEDVGIRLLDAGAAPDLKGSFTETALHWAAYTGLPRLTARLIQAGADVNLRDSRYQATPLGWAIHGLFHTTAAVDSNHYAVAASLVAAGAVVEPEWLTDERVRSDARIMAAISGKGL